MSRETVEEVFRRVQSEARHEARLELQHELERRHQRKLEYRKNREKDARFFHHEERVPPPARTDTNLMKRSRAILGKPKKKVLSPFHSVADRSIDNTISAPAACVLAAMNTPPRRDVSTATDPFCTKYPTKSRCEEITAAKSQDQSAVADHLSDQRQDDISEVDMNLTEQSCGITSGSCASASDIGMADWEKAWYQLTIEEINENKNRCLEWINGSAQ